MGRVVGTEHHIFGMKATDKRQNRNVLSSLRVDIVPEFPKQSLQGTREILVH